LNSKLSLSLFLINKVIIFYNLIIKSWKNLPVRGGINAPPKNNKFQIKIATIGNIFINGIGAAVYDNIINIINFVKFLINK
jgi:hypothetical protein